MPSVPGNPAASTFPDAIWRVHGMRCDAGSNVVAISQLSVTVRLASWWLACYHSAIDAGMWEWADWLAAHPSVEITCP